MLESWKKYITPIYLVIMAAFIGYGFWFRTTGENPFRLVFIFFMLIPILALLYGMGKGTEDDVWTIPIIAAASGVLVYVLTGHDEITFDRYALYLMIGYFAVTWLGIGARRVFEKDFWKDDDSGKKKKK